MEPVQADPPRSRTKHVRIAEDLADKLGEIVEAEGTSSADFLDPLIRTEIENRHRANMPAIRILRSARQRAAKARSEERGSRDVGGEG